MLVFNHYILYIMVIKVGVIENDPFIINKDKLSGFSIDVWEHVAKKHNIEFKYFVIGKNDKIESIIDEEKYDIILGTVGLTPERIRKVDFTSPYYFTNFSLVSLRKDGKKEIFKIVAKFILLFFSFVVTSITILYFITPKKNIKINEMLSYTFKNMSPYVAGARDTELLAKVNYLFGLFLIVLVVIYIYTFFFVKEAENEIPKKPILVDSKSITLIKYLKSRGAQVKVVKTSGGFNNLLDMYLSDTENLAGVFVSEEGKIHKDGSIFNKNPKYQNLMFRRFNFGKSQVSIVVKKNHPLYEIINSELMKMREKGKLFEISKNWLNYAHGKQLEI